MYSEGNRSSIDYRMKNLHDPTYFLYSLLNNCDFTWMVNDAVYDTSSLPLPMTLIREELITFGTNIGMDCNKLRSNKLNWNTSFYAALHWKTTSCGRIFPLKRTRVNLQNIKFQSDPWHESNAWPSHSEHTLTNAPGRSSLVNWIWQISIYESAIKRETGKLALPSLGLTVVATLCHTHTVTSLFVNTCVGGVRVRRIVRDNEVLE